MLQLLLEKSDLVPSLVQYFTPAAEPGNFVALYETSASGTNDNTLAILRRFDVQAWLAATAPPLSERFDMF